MNPQQAAPPVQTISGQIVGIIQKGPDKWQVAVRTDPNSQYSKNLWTKDANLIAQLQTMIGSNQTFVCGESHWTRQDGTPVTSLWINGVGPQAAQPQYQPPPQPQQGTWGQAQAGPPPSNGFTTVGQTMAQPGVVPQQPYVDPKQGMIHRQTASKVAVYLMAIPGILADDVPRNYTTFIALCERLVRYYDHGASWEQPHDGHPDDDVPF